MRSIARFLLACLLVSGITSAAQSSLGLQLQQPATIPQSQPTPQSSGPATGFRQQLLTNSIQPTSGPASPLPPVTPLDPVVLSETSCCADGTSLMPKITKGTFEDAVDQGMVGSSTVASWPNEAGLPAGNTVNTPLGSNLLPYYVSSRNIIFRIPGYIGWMDDAHPNAQGQTPLQYYSVTIVAQALQGPDISDPTGYDWTDISAPVSSDPSFPATFGQSPAYLGELTWMDTRCYFYNSLFQRIDISASNPPGTLPPKGAYRLAKMGSGLVDDAIDTNHAPPSNPTPYTVDLPVVLPQLANIVRFSVVMHVPGESDVQFYSGIVPVIDMPTALVQAKAIPVAIIYQPPGNKSDVEYSSSTTTVTGFQVSQATANQTNWSASISQSTANTTQMGFSLPNIPVLGSISYNQTIDDSQSWDTKASASKSDNDNATNSVKLSYQLSTDSKLQGNPASGQPYSQPFWNDVFVIAPHPQFAFWNFLPSQGNSTTQGGIVASLLAANTQGAMPVPVRLLDGCANNSGTHIALYQNNSGQTEYLEQQDCQLLLEMDPFYAHGQHADVSSLATSEAPVNLAAYNLSDTIALSTTTSTETDATTTSQFVTAIDASQGNTAKVGMQGKIGGWINAGTQTSTTLSSANGNALTFTFTNAASKAATLSTSAARTIGDDGTGNQVPVYGQAFIDNRFGTWMFQSYLPHTCYTGGLGDGCSTSCANLTCKPPCVTSSGDIICPAVASTTGSWTANAPAQAKCGDTVVINGFGMTEVNSVQFVPTDTAQVTYTSPSILVQSDDVVTATLNAPGNATYSVTVTSNGSTVPITVGHLVVTGECPSK